MLPESFSIDHHTFLSFGQERPYTPLFAAYGVYGSSALTLDPAKGMSRFVRLKRLTWPFGLFDSFLGLRANHIVVSIQFSFIPV